MLHLEIVLSEGSYNIKLKQTDVLAYIVSRKTFAVTLEKM
jgi:hypothetical protein